MRSVKERLNPVVTREGSYAVGADAFTLTTTLLGEFRCAALQHDSLPVIVIYPDLGDFDRYHTHRVRRYEPLLAGLVLVVMTLGFNVIGHFLRRRFREAY